MELGIETKKIDIKLNKERLIDFTKLLYVLQCVISQKNNSFNLITFFLNIQIMKISCNPSTSIMTFVLLHWDKTRLTVSRL